MTEDEVREMLREKAGPRGVAAWCRDHGIAEQFASTFLCGDRPPGPTLLKAMGLEKCYTPVVLGLQSVSEGA